MMKIKTYVVAVLTVAACVVTGTAQSRPAVACNASTDTAFVQSVAFYALRGMPTAASMYPSTRLQVELADNLRYSYVGPNGNAAGEVDPVDGGSDGGVQALPVPTAACHPALAPFVRLAVVTHAHQQAFIRRAVAFPHHPTVAQWNAQWKPMLQAAAEFEREGLLVLTAEAKYGLSGDDAAARADRAWLIANEKDKFGKVVR